MSLVANLERHRNSNFQMMATKLVNFKTGYKGNLIFVDGTPNMFWIFKESPGLSQLQKYLDVKYGDKIGDGGGKGLTTGSLVLAKYSADRLYYRARVQEVVVKDCDPGECMYSVCFMDYGNSEVVSGTELMTWDTRLEELPEQAMACCLEGAPQQWREPGGKQWTMEQLEAFHRTMRRGEIQVQLRAERRQAGERGKARFEALVWMEGENVLQILKRLSVFAEDFESWEPVEQSQVEQVEQVGQSQVEQVEQSQVEQGGNRLGSEMFQRRKSNEELMVLDNGTLNHPSIQSTARNIRSESLTRDSGISLMSPLNGGTPCKKVQQLNTSDTRKAPEPISTVREQDTQDTLTYKDLDEPLSPVDLRYKWKVQDWLNKLQETDNIEDDNSTNTFSECNSANVSFAETGQEVQRNNADVPGITVNLSSNSGDVLALLEERQDELSHINTEIKENMEVKGGSFGNDESFSNSYSPATGLHMIELSCSVNRVFSIGDRAEVARILTPLVSELVIINSFGGKRNKKSDIQKECFLHIGVSVENEDQFNAAILTANSTFKGRGFRFKPLFNKEDILKNLVNVETIPKIDCNGMYSTTVKFKLPKGNKKKAEASLGKDFEKNMRGCEVEKISYGPGERILQIGHVKDMLRISEKVMEKFEIIPSKHTWENQAIKERKERMRTEDKDRRQVNLIEV